MSQETILKVLKKNGGWMSAREIRNHVDISQTTVHKQLKTLVNFKEAEEKIGQREFTGLKGIKEWRAK